MILPRKGGKTSGKAKPDDRNSPPWSGPGFPNGWFAVAFSSDIRRGKLAQRMLAGKEILLYRTSNGLIRAVDPYCPHLGANLGVGGSVEGENLVCPFHRFAFNPSGACVKTEYGTEPPRAFVRHYECDEVNGVVFAWHDAKGGPPAWSIPPRDLSSYPYSRAFSAHLRGHPQDVVENAVDLGHITPVHRYDRPKLRKPFETDEHIMRISPEVRRKMPLLGELGVDFTVEAHGLGYEFVSATVLKPRISFAIQMMPTLLSHNTMTIRFTVSARPQNDKLDNTAGQILSRALTVVAGRFLWRDFALDFPIWANKTYLKYPKLAHGDGPIPKFRRWSQQFYTEDASAHPTAPGAGAQRSTRTS